MTGEELDEGSVVVHNKTIETEGINFCFVGRVEKEKGIGLLLDAFMNLSDEEKSKVNTIHVVGDGKQFSFFKKKGEESNLNIKFHGFLSRESVHDIYKTSHAIVLPSASEGFPKVISEAMNYGCLPIVSDISSISHYIKNGVNGFLIHPINADTLRTCLSKMISLTDENYLSMIQNDHDKISRFSYAYYNTRIKDDILH